MSLLGSLLCGAIGGVLFSRSSTKHIHHYHYEPVPKINTNKDNVKIVRTTPMIGVPSNEIFESIKSNLFNQEDAYDFTDVINEVFKYSLYYRECSNYVVHQFKELWIDSGILKMYLDDLIFGSNFQVEIRNNTLLYIRDTNRTINWTVFDLLSNYLREVDT